VQLFSIQVQLVLLVRAKMSVRHVPTTYAAVWLPRVIRAHCTAASVQWALKSPDARDPPAVGDFTEAAGHFLKIFDF